MADPDALYGVEEERSDAPGDFRGPYGYGRPAHKADPSAAYQFDIGPPRALPPQRSIAPTRLISATSTPIEHAASGHLDRSQVFENEPYGIYDFAEKMKIAPEQARELIRVYGSDRDVLEREAQKLK